MVQSVQGQIESVESPPPRYVWVSHGRLEGHLALNYSPAGAFSPDSSTLAVVNNEKVVLMDLRGAGIRKLMRPRVGEVTDLQIQSANFLAPHRVFILATGLIRTKGSSAPLTTPLLAFQWDTDRDALIGKVNSVGAGGGFGPPRYFPQIMYIAFYKKSNFNLWNPTSGRGGAVTISALTRQPNLFEFSPDGRWLLLAQIETSSTADPVIVDWPQRQFVDSLRGHQGTVLGIAFSRDSRKVLTACEDGKVRVWSAPEWKPLHTLEGHQGPVHGADFSADGSRVVSVGEDKTMRIWSAEDGKIHQTLAESDAPLRSVAFSPDGEYVAASAEQFVLVWQRRRAD